MQKLNLNHQHMVPHYSPWLKMRLLNCDKDPMVTFCVPVAFMMVPHNKLLMLVVFIPISLLVHVIVLIGVVFTIVCM